MPKLQRFHRWSLGMHTLFHPTPYSGCNNLSMLVFKLIHVCKRGHCWPTDVSYRGLNKMADNLLTPFSSIFSWKKSLEFVFIFRWSIFVRVWKTIIMGDASFYSPVITQFTDTYSSPRLGELKRRNCPCHNDEVPIHILMLFQFQYLPTNWTNGMWPFIKKSSCFIKDLGHWWWKRYTPSVEMEICNYIHWKVWDDISYPFPNFNG